MGLLLDTAPALLCMVKLGSPENRSERSMRFATNGPPQRTKKRPPIFRPTASFRVALRSRSALLFGLGRGLRRVILSFAILRLSRLRRGILRLGGFSLGLGWRVRRLFFLGQRRGVALEHLRHDID